MSNPREPSTLTINSDTPDREEIGAQAETGTANEGPSPQDFADARAMGARSLAEHHRRVLEEDRAIAEAVWQERGTFTYEDALTLQALGLPAFPAPGMVIPIHPPAGFKPGEWPIYAIRPDRPADPKRKYSWPAGVPMRLDAPLRCHADLGNPAKPLDITEGWFKADALVSAGRCSVGLLGTSAFGWKPEPGLRILSDWKAIELNGRQVNIWFDSDARRKPAVALARVQLTRMLQLHGARVKWGVLPDAPDGSKQGVDDWLAAPGHSGAKLDSLLQDPEDPLMTAQLTDVGNAERFALVNSGLAIYIQGVGWLAWNGGYWKQDADLLVDRLARNTMRELLHLATNLPHSQERDALLDHARRSESRQRLEAMVHLARVDLLAETDELDRDLWLLNCPNGTIDLRSGALRPHDPADLITRQCPVDFDPEAPCPTWEAFLLAAMGGDAEMVAYLQQMVGIFLTGDVSEKFLPILWGPPDTGKTTFTNTLRALFGPYAQTMSEATISNPKWGASGGEATPDVARLLGTRLAVVSETSAKMQLNAARAKAWTGRNRLTARKLYKEPFDFNPTHKLLIETNNKPGLPEGDEALFNRLHLIPFQVPVPKAEQDSALETKLQVELSGILTWAVRGCLVWQQKGRLEQPKPVAEATKDYRAENDHVQAFLSARCVEGSKENTGVPRLYAAYALWAAENVDGQPLGKQVFNRQLEGRGFRRDQQKRNWQGLELAPEPESESGPEPATNIFTFGEVR